MKMSDKKVIYLRWNYQFQQSILEQKPNDISLNSFVIELMQNGFLIKNKKINFSIVDNCVKLNFKLKNKKLNLRVNENVYEKFRIYSNEEILEMISLGLNIFLQNIIIEI